MNVMNKVCIDFKVFLHQNKHLLTLFFHELFEAPSYTSQAFVYHNKLLNYWNLSYLRILIYSENRNIGILYTNFQFISGIPGGNLLILLIFNV